MRALRTGSMVALSIAVALLTRAVVRLENYRYANSVGLCAEYSLRDAQQLIEREKCLNAVETRTHWVWHVLYGLGLM